MASTWRWVIESHWRWAMGDRITLARGRAARLGSQRPGREEDAAPPALAEGSKFIVTPPLFVLYGMDNYE